MNFHEVMSGRICETSQGAFKGNGSSIRFRQGDMSGDYFFLATSGLRLDPSFHGQGRRLAVH